MSPQKIAIVCSGGGMRCTYSAGALVALAREYNLTEPYLAIGNSGSAGSLAYYLARQYDSLRNIWTNILASRRFIWLLRFWNICNVDWLVDSVMKEIDPLDTVRLEHSQTRFFITAFNMDDGKMRYFDRSEADTFELLRATKAMPIIFNHDVKIEGTRYRDGAICTSIPGLIEQAFTLGANRVIAIDSRPAGTSIFFTLYERLLSTNLRAAIAEEKQRELKGYPSLLEHSQDIIWIRPKRLPANLLTSDRARLEKSFELGYRDIKENQELKAFLRQE